jgi:purine-nucleoside phosphorylase
MSYACDLLGLTSEQQRLVDLACKVIAGRRLLQPKVAIVLGSGLGGLADCVEHTVAINYPEIPGFAVAQAAGHAGRLITGFLSGLPVVLMQGRCHRYEGHSTAQLQFPVLAMQALGAQTLITTNAAGGLNSRFQVGDLMVIDSHIDYLWPGCRQEISKPADRVALHQRFSLDGHAGRHLEGRTLRGHPPYSRALIGRAKAIALQRGLSLQQGCYLATLGPTYETRAEYRMFRWLGADAVGMSTIPEVIAARGLGMDVLAFSVITNVASTDMASQTTHAEVVQSGNQAGPKLQTIIAQLLSELSGQPD